jgi:hypothetical protein
MIAGSVIGMVCTMLGIVGAVALVGRKMKRDADALSDVADMRSVALVRLGDVEDEAMVRVVGRVAPYDRPVTAPVSGRPCVAYAVELYVGGNVRPLVTGGEVRAFYVEDGGVRALVQPPCPIVALTARHEGRRTPAELTPAFAAWLEENHASDDWRHEKRLRFVEHRLEPGERAAIVGVARREVDGDAAFAGYREPPQLVVFETADDAPLSVSDDPSLLG